ncbi:hypothetical protein OG921_20510 [Aldersonia sp. NBC_00410]|uniref:hypothetical protein n=1 Tax=Aldersonia sp. NBC_00410 TaxID=2975954 RepID=UPI00224EB0C2|nr:hypothetical protein [Aldersonia sp. NBC_00410]MCX5045552.1 hypothetical protein [Aldersonia sp. NBC_00410]
MRSGHDGARPRWIRVSGAVLLLAFVLPFLVRIPVLLLAVGVLGACVIATMLPERTERTERAAPAPRRLPDGADLAQRWLDAQTALMQLDDEWLSFVTDPESLFLTRPLLLDRADPVIGEYHRAWDAAKTAAARHPLGEGGMTAVDLTRLERRVTAAWDAWLRADARARAVGLDNFRSGERVALRRSRKIIALMDDPATTPAFRDELLTALRRALDQLETIRISTHDLRRIPELMTMDLRELE